MNYEQKEKIISETCQKILLNKVAMITASKTDAPSEIQKKFCNEFLKIQEPIFSMYAEELNKVINPVNPIILPTMLAIFTPFTKMLESQCTEEDKELSHVIQQSITTIATKFDPEDLKK